MRTIASFLLVLLVSCESSLTVPKWDHGAVICSAKSIIIELDHRTDKEVAELFKLAEKCKEKMSVISTKETK